MRLGAPAVDCHSVAGTSCLVFLASDTIRLICPYIFHKGRSWSGFVAPSFSASVLDEGELFSYTLRPVLPTVESLRFSLPRELVVPQTRSGRFRKQINIFPLPAIEPRFLGCINRSPDATDDALLSSVRRRSTSLWSAISFKNDVWTKWRRISTWSLHGSEHLMSSSVSFTLRDVAPDSATPAARTRTATLWS